MRAPLRLLGVGLLAGLLAALLGGCGFHLRNQGEAMHFSRLHLEGTTTGSFPQGLQKALRRYPGLTLTDQAASAEVRLQILNERRERVILSLTTAGRVREVTLRERVQFQALTPEGEILLAPAELISERVLSVNDPDTLAKDSEATVIYQQLEADSIHLLLLRLAALQLPRSTTQH